MITTPVGPQVSVNLHFLTTEVGSISEKPCCIEDNEKGPVHVSHNESLGYKTTRNNALK